MNGTLIHSYVQDALLADNSLFIKLPNPHNQVPQHLLSTGSVVYLPMNIPQDNKRTITIDKPYLAIARSRNGLKDVFEPKCCYMT